MRNKSVVQWHYRLVTWGVLGSVCGCFLWGQPRRVEAEPPDIYNGDSSKDNPAAFEVQLQLNHTTVLPFEPIGAIATLRNVSNAPASLTTQGWGASYWMRRQEKGQWVNYARYYPYPISFPGIPALTTRVFVPQQTHDSYENLALLQDSPSFHALQDPGVYDVRVRYLNIYSPVTTLTVRQPTGKDLGAYQFLMHHSADQLNSLDRYFTSDALLLDLVVVKEIDEMEETGASHETIEEFRRDHRVDVSAWRAQLTTLIRQYPQSRYAQWSRLSLLFLEDVPATFAALHEKDRRHKVPDSMITKLKAAHTHAAQLAPQLPDVLSGAAWYEAGVMSLLLGQHALSEQEFKNATYRDVTIARRIQDARSPGGMATRSLVENS